MVKFSVNSTWQGKTKSQTAITAYQLGGETITKDFTLDIDEPHELLGDNTAPNPQEVLMAALNACMTVGYVVGAATKGITLEKLEIKTEGELDLRGFLGIDKQIKPGYDEIYYTVTIKGNGTEEQYCDIHDTVMKTSPNFWNISNPITLVPRLVIE
jgi:uncharacterized OsmC-like protein